MLKSSRNHQNIAHKVRLLDESYLARCYEVAFRYFFLKKERNTIISVFQIKMVMRYKKFDIFWF